MKEKGRRPQGKADLQMTDDDTSRRIAITASGSADQADATSLSSDPANRLHPENPDRVMPRLDLLTTCFSTDAIFAGMAGFPINTQGHGVIHHRRASLGPRDT